MEFDSIELAGGPSERSRNHLFDRLVGGGSGRSDCTGIVACDSSVPRQDSVDPSRRHGRRGAGGDSSRQGRHRTLNDGNIGRLIPVLAYLPDGKTLLPKGTACQQEFDPFPDAG
ncbi:hypothetical protein OG474_41180 [Kribbella sp. NBC_01505]|uniref:hypothetical protein n=1 Tax=Kribbella sp. NBC_01505 TaxID=2903580 RepID=UPI00386858E5